MSGTENSGSEERASAATDAQATVNSFIFDADVHEVFLLIDHISGRSEKSLKDLDTSGIELPALQGDHQPQQAAVAAVPSNQKPSVSDVLYRLCQIGYPRHPDPMTRAAKAAFVLGIKDRLNALASPARGITVAYTAMFVSSTGRCSIISLRKPEEIPARHAARNDLAKEAYPVLESHAKCFSRLSRQFPWLMAIMLVLTASAYWDVGFGRTIVQRIEQISKERFDLLHPAQKPATGAVTEKECQSGANLTSEQTETCVRADDLEKQITDSRADLYNFSIAALGDPQSGLVLRVLAWFRPVHYGFVFNGQVPPQNRPEASVAWVLSLFSTYVLPAMFGLLGTLAAIMRAIQGKVRDSLLGPRDLPLSILGLFIGPMAGLAVGLYFTPTGTTTAGSAGLAGSVSLSASGLGFLAGYGADAFFKFVDALLIRVFALDQPSK
jgi:hypothetical protein